MDFGRYHNVQVIDTEFDSAASVTFSFELHGIPEEVLNTALEEFKDSYAKNHPNTEMNLSGSTVSVDGWVTIDYDKPEETFPAICVDIELSDGWTEVSVLHDAFTPSEAATLVNAALTVLREGIAAIFAAATQKIMKAMKAA